MSLAAPALGFIGYLSNGAFPDPLTEDEEAACLRSFWQGDQEARSILIERNLRLVAHIAKKFEGSGEDQDDLISIGTIGLIKAVNTYDPEKGTKLATYAAKCIENDNSKSIPSGCAMPTPVGPGHAFYLFLGISRVHLQGHE